MGTELGTDNGKSERHLTVISNKQQPTTDNQEQTATNDNGTRQ
jgi:hypothetical protein